MAPYIPHFPLHRSTYAADHQEGVVSGTLPSATTEGWLRISGIGGARISGTGSPPGSEAAGKRAGTGCAKRRRGDLAEPIVEEERQSRRSLAATTRRAVPASTMTATRA